MALTHSSTISSGPGHTPAGGQRSKGETGWDKLNKTGWGVERGQRKGGRMDREHKNQTSRPTGTY